MTLLIFCKVDKSYILPDDLKSPTMVLQLLANEPALIRSIFSGDRSDVKGLLENNADVNYVDCEKRSPLHAAACKGDSDIVEMLITIGGARVNTKDNRWLTPLHRACASRVSFV